VPARGIGGGQRLAFVLWDGTLGGAESLAVELARRARELGHEPSVVFISEPAPMIDRVRTYGVPALCLGLARGRQLVRHARRFANVIARSGADLAICPGVDYMAWALRLGGYTGTLIGVEHGDLFAHQASRTARRLVRHGDRALAVRTLDAEVVVSDFMKSASLRSPHGRRVVVIPNGVDTVRFSPGGSAPPAEPVVFGFAGRLIPGKGVDRLIDAAAALARHGEVRVRIAGDGPARGELERRARETAAADLIEFVPTVHDMPAFWRSVHVGVAASDTHVESFGMAPLEAMACGRPVVATRNGGLSDLVDDGVSGRLVASGDTTALERALTGYLDSSLRADHGRAARRAAVERFSLDACLEGYLRLRGARRPGGRAR
jgi:glycosyltransferase involved in cell wall biosynthesis